MLILPIFISVISTFSLKVITSPWTPLVNCTIGSKDISQASGYYIDLISKINSTLSLGLSFECMDFSSVLQQVQNGQTNDTFAAGCISINYNLSKSLKFSTPTYDSGLILITKKQNISYLWLIFMPFSNTMWAFLFFMIISNAHLIWMAEQHEKGPIHIDYSSGILAAFHHSLLTLFLMGDVKIRTIPGRMIQISYWFMGIILIGAYLFNMSAILSIEWMSSSIESYQDLQNQMVGTFEDYVSELNLYTNYIKSYTWTFESSVRMLDDLKAGKIQAAALPYPFALYLSKSDCSYLIIGQKFIVNYFALAFPLGFDENIYRKITKTNLDLYQKNYHRNLENKWVLVSDSATCDYNAEIPIPLSNVGGIYITLTVVFIIDLIIVVTEKVLKGKLPEIKSKEPTGVKKTDIKEAAELDLVSKFEGILNISKRKIAQKVKDFKQVSLLSSKQHQEVQEALEDFSLSLRNLY